jgi:hypothetical protein
MRLRKVQFTSEAVQLSFLLKSLSFFHQRERLVENPVRVVEGDRVQMKASPRMLR